MSIAINYKHHYSILSASRLIISRLPWSNSLMRERTAIRMFWLRVISFYTLTYSFTCSSVDLRAGFFFHLSSVLISLFLEYELFSSYSNWLSFCFCLGFWEELEWAWFTSFFSSGSTLSYSAKDCWCLDCGFYYWVLIV